MEPYLSYKLVDLGLVGMHSVTKRYHNDMKDNTKMVPFKKLVVDSKTVIFNKFKTKEVNKETKIGLIGAGRWGPNVIGAVNRINGAKPVKVVDPTKLWQI